MNSEQTDFILVEAKRHLSPASFNIFATLHSGGAIKPTPSQDDQSYLCYLAILLDSNKDMMRQYALSSARAEVPHHDHKQGRHKWHYNKTYLTRSINKACKFVENTRHSLDSQQFRTWQQVKRCLLSRKNPPTEAQQQAAIEFIAKRYLPHKHAEKLAEIGLQDHTQELEQARHGDELLNRLNFNSGDWRGYNIQRLQRGDLIEGRYLPDVDMLCYDTLFVQSDLGTGKTELARRLIMALGTDKSVLVITPRRSLTIGSAIRLNIANYEDVKLMPTETKEQRERKAAMARCMACTINSVQDLIKDDFKFDLIIIDESELLALHLIGGAFDNKEKGLQHFYKLVKNADKVLFLDAFLSPITRYLAEQCGRPVSTTKVVVNPFHIWGNQVSVKWFEGNKDGESLAIDKLFKNIEQSINLFCFSNSNEKINALYAEACAKFPNKQFLLIDKKTVGNDQQTAFLADPYNECARYACVFCSPTVETGLSIDNPLFKCVFGFFENTDSTGTATGAIQQLARCRKSTEWNVFCRDMVGDAPTDETLILDGLKASYLNAVKECQAVEQQLINIETIFSPTLVTELFCKVKAWENAQKNDFHKSLHTLLTRFMGCTIDPQQGLSLKGENLLAHGKQLAADQYAEDIANAEDIDQSDYETLTSDRKSKQYADNRTACERYELRDTYRIKLEGFEVVRNAQRVCSLNELLELDKKGKGARKAIMALETATASTQDVLRYGAANLIGNDFLNIAAREQSARVHSLPTQHRVRKLALEAIGISDVSSVDWDNAPQWTETDILNSAFARYVSANLTAVNAAHIGVKFPHNWQGKACYYFSYVVRAMGFDVYQLSQVKSPAHEKLQQGGDVLSIKDNSATLLQAKTDKKLNKKEKRSQIRIYSLGKTSAFCFFEFRKDDGINWITERLRKLKQYEQASHHVQHAEATASKLQSLVNTFSGEDYEREQAEINALGFDNDDSLSDCFDTLSSAASTDSDVQKMLDDVVQTLCNIESNTKQYATKAHLVECCHSYINAILPAPLLPESDLKLIKKLQKSPKGLQLGTIVGRVFGFVDAESIGNTWQIVKHLASIGACSIQKDANDKLKSMIKLVDVSPIYSCFSGVVL